MKVYFDEQLPKLSGTGLRKQINKSNIQLALPQKNCWFAPNVFIDTYGKNSVKYKSTKICNELQRIFNLDLLDQSRPKSKNLINEYFLNMYHNKQ